MGTFLICPLRGQKGTYLPQVRPLLLANQECPHFADFQKNRNVRIYAGTSFRLNSRRNNIIETTACRNMLITDRYQTCTS